MPEQAVRAALDRWRRRLRLVTCADAAVTTAVVTSLLVVVGLSRTMALGAGTVAGVAVGVFGWRRLSDFAVARQLEQRTPQFDNLLVTSQEALSGRRLHPVLVRELMQQTASRLEQVDWRWTRAEIARLVTAVATVATTIVVMRAGPPALTQSSSPVLTKTTAAVGSRLRVVVVPPSYAQRSTTRLDNPTRVEALEGSTLRIEWSGVSTAAEAMDASGQVEHFVREKDAAVLTLTATTSRVFLMRDSQNPTSERLLQIDVRPDQRPTVAIEKPGRDLIFASPSGTVPVVVTARDDLGIAAVSVRYTRITGGGENFTFEEGELPVEVTRTDPGSVQGRGVLVLDQLRLEEGDTLVYRALARDQKPGSDPATSDSFLVEIGKRAEALAGGFAVPDDRDRQALSQQMLIMKTERLHGARASLTPDALLEQSRLLAVEQRMVRAEFIFMTGGEVVDEVEEAEHSDDLAQGRLENQGQIELLNAMREMSRAETRLNGADTAQALVFERAALAALQKAFDRRRYFLRTLPERARIDQTRRFSGDVSAARPRRPEAASSASDPTAVVLRDALKSLATAIESGRGVDARLAARLLALDPRAPAFREFATALVSSTHGDDTATAARRAERHLGVLLRQRLAAGATNSLTRDPLAGALNDRAPRGLPQ